MNFISLGKVCSGILMLLLLAGCRKPAASPKIQTIEPAPAGKVSPPPPVLPTATVLQEGPVVLAQTYPAPLGGTIYGHGRTAVILASRGGHSRTEWSSFAQFLAGKGYTALTLGSSDGEGTTVQYVQFAIEFLRANGFREIVCMGASNGASGCAFNAYLPEIKGLVLLTYHGNADLTNIPCPKIFIAGAATTYKISTEKGYQAADEPRTLVLIPDSAETGPSLLDAPGLDLRNKVLDMLAEGLDR
jgi:hypothetical protein